jgi:hypothetical protein
MKETGWHGGDYGCGNCNVGEEPGEIRVPYVVMGPRCHAYCL